MQRFWAYTRSDDGTGAPVAGATVTVYVAGSLTPATIYADTLSTPKSNPFTADVDGFFYFYAAHGLYDIALSGDGITLPYTWADVQLIDQDDPAFLSEANAFVGDQTITGDLTVSGALSVGGVALVNSSGQLSGLTATTLADLSGASLTTLNASALASGTVPSARVSGTYSQALALTNVANAFAAATLSLGAAPALTGALNLTFGEAISARNTLNSADIELLKLSTDDYAVLANAYLHHAAPLADDTYNLGASNLRWRNGHIKDLYVTEFLQLGASSTSGTGWLRGKNNQVLLAALNAAGSGDVALLKFNANDRLEVPVLQLMNGVTALGGGSTATLGTIGGSGPAVLTQNGWLVFYSAAGTKVFVPYWV